MQKTLADHVSCLRPGCTIGGNGSHIGELEPETILNFGKVRKAENILQKK